MAGFLYFIPGQVGSAVSVSQLPGDLPSVLADRSLETGSPIIGPDGSSGAVVAISGSRPNLTIYRDQPDKQRWAPVFDTSERHPNSANPTDVTRLARSTAGDPAAPLGGSSDIAERLEDRKPLYWIGYDVGAFPTPEELLRPKPTGGRRVTMADERAWIIPSVACREIDLPMKYHYDPAGGGFAFRIDERYEQVVRQSQRFFPYVIQGQSDMDFTYGDVFRFFSDVLSINYHVGMIECCFGHPVWSSEEFKKGHVWGAIYGMTDLMEDLEQKKGEGATSPLGTAA